MELFGRVGCDDWVEVCGLVVFGGGVVVELWWYVGCGVFECEVVLIFVFCGKWIVCYYCVIWWEIVMWLLFLIGVVLVVGMFVGGDVVGIVVLGFNFELFR